MFVRSNPLLGAGCDAETKPGLGQVLAAAVLDHKQTDQANHRTRHEPERNRKLATAVLHEGGDNGRGKTSKDGYRQTIGERNTCRTYGHWKKLRNQCGRWPCVNGHYDRHADLYDNQCTTSRIMSEVSERRVRVEDHANSSK